MGSETLTTAILGLNDAGRALLQAAVATGLFQIRAVADHESPKAQKAATEYGCEAYSDYRQLIVQNQLDCLIVAADTHACDEQIKAAIRKKFNILKLAPLARNFEEALEYVQMGHSENIRFAVANPARYQAACMSAHELIVQGGIEHVSLVTAYCHVDAADRPAWQSDPKLAGGGVLLHDCCQTIDQILWSFPLPQQVYALQTNQALDKQQRLSRTEDTALVALRFTDALVGGLLAAPGDEPGPGRFRIEVQGKESRLTVTGTEVTLRTQGQTDRTWQYEQDEQAAMEQLLSDYALSLLNPGRTLASSAAENLRNMAVLESAYLSARTGFPEEPARILRLAGNLAGAAARV